VPETLSVQGNIMHAEQHTHTHTLTQTLPVASAIVAVSTSQLSSSPPGKEECISDKNYVLSSVCVCVCVYLQGRGKK